MALTKYTAAQAVRRANSYAYYKVGMCLNFCWVCVDYPNSAGLYDANAAWNRATMKRYTGNPPAGAMVYWAVGSHGHIAVSLGGGMVRSTDWPSKGRVGNVSISRLSSAWGARYRGWSADYAGKGIPGLVNVTYPGTMAVDLASVIKASNLRPGARNNDVARFERALWNALGGPYRASILANKAQVGDGFYGTITQKMCSDAYAKYGMSRATYPGGTALLTRLGFKAARV